MAARSERSGSAAGGRWTTRPQPLIGRDGPLTRLIDSLTTGSALVVLEGEAGIGKTRLVGEALSILDRSSIGPRHELVATCPAVSEPAPLGAIVAGIRRLAPDINRLGTNPLGGALRPLFPEWSTELPAAPDPLDDPIAVRHQLFRALTDLVERIGVSVLVIEDVHWADIATLEWLLTLCADTPAGGRQLSIVLTVRPWEVPEGSLLPRLTARAHPGMSRLRVELAPLTVEQVRELVASMYPTGPVSAEFAAFLHRATDGIPLVVEEYLLLLEDRADIVQVDGRWTRRILTELEVPATVRESVLERVHRLEPATRRLLEAAGVLADPADEELLAEVAALDEPTTRQALAAGLGSGLLRERSPGRFAFRHVLDAQAIRAAVPVSERRRLHGRAARALQRGDRPPMARLAHHFRESGDVERWAACAEASADVAWESGDDRTAVEALLQVVTTPQKTFDQRVQLARKIGQMAFFGAATLGALTGQVVKVLRGVLDSAEIGGPDRGELRLLLGRMLWAIGKKPAAFEQWEAAVADLGHRPDLALRAMSNMALPLYADWPVARHRQWLDRAAQLLDHVAPADRLAFEDIRTTVLLLLGEQDGWAALTELTRSAKTRTDERGVANSLLNAVWASLAWGRFEEAGKQLAVTMAHIESADYSRLADSAEAAGAVLDWYVGRWSDLRDRSNMLADNDNADLQTRLHARHVLGLLQLATGNRQDALRILQDVVADYARLGITEPASTTASAALARIHLADGDAAEALAVTSPVVELIEHKGVWMWIADIGPVHLDTLLDTAMNTTGATAAGTGGAAARHFVTLLDDHLANSDVPAVTAALVTCRAILTEADGDHESAAAGFAVAAEKWAALPRPYDELLSRERQGRSLLAAGRPDHGLEVLDRCLSRLQDLGARWDADRVAQLVRENGVDVVRAWRGGRRGYGDQLSPRELDVLRLVATGMTNRRTAEALFVSPRTVEGHLTSAMRKLGVTSRTALAVAAVDAGLVSPAGPGPS